MVKFGKRPTPLRCSLMPAEMVSHTSVRYALKAGDLIQCGTASGVGNMKPGDMFEIEFEGIGVLRNLAVAGNGHGRLAI